VANTHLGRAVHALIAFSNKKILPQLKKKNALYEFGNRKKKNHRESTQMP
jgi:hypothetical protein